MPWNLNFAASPDMDISVYITLQLQVAEVVGEADECSPVKIVSGGNSSNAF